MHIAEQMYMSKQKQNQIKAKYKVKQFKERIDTATNWIINECFGRPGRFPGIAGNTGNHGNDGKFHTTKVTKYLTKFKETLINYFWEKSRVKKQ